MYNLVTPMLQGCHLLIALWDVRGHTLPMLMRVNLLILLILLILLVLHKTQSFVCQVVGATPLPLYQAQQIKQRMPPIAEWRTSQVDNPVTPLLQAWHSLIALQDASGHTLLMLLMHLNVLILLILLVLHKTQSFMRQVVGATPLPVCQAQQMMLYTLPRR